MQKRKYAQADLFATTFSSIYLLLSRYLIIFILIVPFIVVNSFQLTT